MISYLEAFKSGVVVEPIQIGWEWADNYLYLPEKGNPLPGKYSSSLVPPLREVAEALSVDNECQEVTLMKGVQGGGTINGLIAVLQRMHQAPRDIICTFPTLELARIFSKDKLTPTIEATPCLKGKLKDSRERDSNNLIDAKDFPGGSIKMVSANSAAALRMSSASFIYCEEIDEYKYDLKGQGNPIELVWNRANNYSNKKLYMVSTPTEKGTSEIEKKFLLGTQEYCYLPCPFCKFKQVIKWGNLKYKDDDPSTVRLECIECHEPIEEKKHKMWMLENYEWRAHNRNLKNKKKRSFHYPSLYSYIGWLSWEDCVAKWLNIKDDRALLKTFQNTILAETSEENYDKMDDIKARREKYNAEVPNDVIILTCAVDVQKNRLEVLTMGWGLGDRSWTIEQEIIIGSPADDFVWDSLDIYLQKKFKHESGVELGITSTCIDTAGGFEKKAYEFCKNKLHRRIFAIKGSSMPGKPSVSRPSKSNKGNVDLHMLGTDTIKRILFARLKKSNPADLGYCHFHEALDDEFFLQLDAEKLILVENKKGYRYYTYKKVRERNEAIDLCVYNIAALEILNPNWVKVVNNFSKKIANKKVEAVPIAFPAKEEIPDEDFTEENQDEIEISSHLLPEKEPKIEEKPEPIPEKLTLVVKETRIIESEQDERRKKINALYQKRQSGIRNW